MAFCIQCGQKIDGGWYILRSDDDGEVRARFLLS